MCGGKIYVNCHDKLLVQYIVHDSNCTSLEYTYKVLTANLWGVLFSFKSIIIFSPFLLEAVLPKTGVPTKENNNTLLLGRDEAEREHIPGTTAVAL